MSKPVTQNPDHEFWSELLLPRFQAYLAEIAADTPAQQASHVNFFDSLLRHLGPKLPHPHIKAMLTVPYMPLGFSVNLSDKRKPISRMEIEPLDAESGSSKDPFATAPILACFDTLEAGMPPTVYTHWAHQLREAFNPLSHEVAQAKTRLPPYLDRFSLGYFGITFDGDKRAMKYCSSHIPKFLGSSGAGAKTSDEFLFNAVCRLEPGGAQLSPAVDAVAKYFQTEKSAALPSPLLFTGLDCTEPSTARVKMYGRTQSTAFSNVRNIVTMGGVINNHETIEYLNRLGSIWHLLLNDPLCRSDETYNRPPLDPTFYRKGLLVSFEVTARRPTPDVKVYVPFFQYHKNDTEAIRNLEQVFESFGWDWGNGKYASLVQKIRYSLPK